MGEIKMFRKRGIFFTFIAITIMVVFILIFTPQSNISLEKEKQDVSARISSINNFVDDLEGSYFETVLRVATHKTILSLINYIETKKAFIPSEQFNTVFSEVMINGTISDPIGSDNHVPIDKITGKKIMFNNTLLNWSKRINQTAKDTLNIDTNITIINVTVNQSEPWSVDSYLTFNSTVKSGDIPVEWKRRNVVIKATVSIEGFHDPYYFVNTNGAYIAQINKSNVQFDQWDISKVREHLRFGNYTHFENSDAPTFLMRLTNDFSDKEQKKCCGIESLVNPNKITPADQEESYVDYLFWTHKFSDCKKLWNIISLWDKFPNFKLDHVHVKKYNIKEGTEAEKCE